jgi:hypothetical protein
MLASPAAWAGHPQVRNGFWIGVGAGYGSASVEASCEGCESEKREGAISGFVKLGGTLNEHVLLGAESNVWAKEEEDVTLLLGSVTGTVTFYPRASSGFFLKGGAGFSYVDMQEKSGDVTVSIDKVGWGVLLGAGYDLRVGRNVSLTPCINYHFGKPGDLTANGETLPGWKQDVVSFELGITFH